MYIYIYNYIHIHTTSIGYISINWWEENHLAMGAVPQREEGGATPPFKGAGKPSCHMAKSSRTSSPKEHISASTDGTAGKQPEVSSAKESCCIAAEFSPVRKKGHYCTFLYIFFAYFWVIGYLFAYFAGLWTYCLFVHMFMHIWTYMDTCFGHIYINKCTFMTIIRSIL